MKACGTVHKYGDNVDTDVIIPARYLNSSDPAELAKSCMEDIDPDFVNRVKKGDIMVANKNFGCGSSSPEAAKEIEAGDTVEIDFDSGVIVDKTKGTQYQGQAFPPFMQKIIKAEGLVNYINSNYTE